MEEKSKEKQNRKEYWLHEGIIVKIVTKRLGDNFYKKKGVVRVRESTLIYTLQLWKSKYVNNNIMARLPGLQTSISLLLS